jgi:hypothetical protein
MEEGVDDRITGFLNGDRRAHRVGATDSTACVKRTSVALSLESPFGATSIRV